MEAHPARRQIQVHSLISRRARPLRRHCRMDAGRLQPCSCWKPRRRRRPRPYPTNPRRDCAAGGYNRPEVAIDVEENHGGEWSECSIWGCTMDRRTLVARGQMRQPASISWLLTRSSLRLSYWLPKEISLPSNVPCSYLRKLKWRNHSASAEIYVLGLKYKAPEKIDHRLLDILDVLRGTKQKRHPDGYEDGDTTLRKLSIASEFILSESPLEILGTVSSIAFKDPESLPIKDHTLTTDEVKALCDDLRVLGKQDFKYLLK